MLYNKKYTFFVIIKVCFGFFFSKFNKNFVYEFSKCAYWNAEIGIYIFFSIQLFYKYYNFKLNPK